MQILVTTDASEDPGPNSNCGNKHSHIVPGAESVHLWI